jgi:Protein of unknown function (DUF3343)
MDLTIFTFDTTHHALWAEEIAKENRLAFEIVPAPADSHARCDIAIATVLEDRGRLSELLEEAGVEHRIYGGPQD